MSIEDYGELINMNRIDKSILEAEQEVSNGVELLDAREALSQLRRKHFRSGQRK